MQVEQDFASVITLQDEHVVSVHRYVELPSFPYIPSAIVVTGTDSRDARECWFGQKHSQWTSSATIEYCRLIYIVLYVL